MLKNIFSLSFRLPQGSQPISKPSTFGGLGMGGPGLGSCQAPLASATSAPPPSFGFSQAALPNSSGNVNLSFFVSC